MISISSSWLFMISQLLKVCRPNNIMLCSRNTKLKTPSSSGQDYERQDEATQRWNEEQAVKSAEKKKKNTNCSSGSGQQQQKGSSYYLIKPICLVLFLVLLISQLKAIELPIKKSILVAAETGNITDSRMSETNNNPNPRRFDSEFVSLNYQDSGQTPRSHGIGADSTNDNVEPLEAASTVSQIAVNASPNRVTVQETPTLKDNNTMMSVTNPPVEAPTVLPPSATSLAEATATGTAVGLLFQDLMTQANMQLNQNQAYQQPDMYNGVQSIGQEMAQLDGGADGEGGEDGNNSDDDDSDGQIARNGQFYNPAHVPNRLNSMNRPEMSRVSTDEQGNILPSSSESGEVPNARSSSLAADGASLLNEEQMPDSMESLMKSAGESYTDDGGDDGQQSASDSNLVNQSDSMNNKISPALPAPQYNGVVTNEDQNGHEQEDDDDEEQGENLLISPNTNRELSVPPQMAAMANEMHQGYPVGMPLIEREASFQQPQATNGHHLMPSIRDSQIDLNTAAGHYYGKKKKKMKKKKKVIIIKKKKKKKKKYKKVKIVKKYKKKKPKKKKKMVHHDHGKYYMYAKVPKKKSWEFGFKKGNKKHWIERHEKGHKNKFKTKVKWYDKKSKGKGVHIWDYNHHDKKKKKHY